MRPLAQTELCSYSDYGFERVPAPDTDAAGTHECAPSFWFNPLAAPDDCALGHTYPSSAG